MARMPELRDLSPKQAHYVLRRALADRKLSAADVRKYSASIHEEISNLEARLTQLRDAAVDQVQKAWERAGKEAPRVIRRARKSAKRARKAVSSAVAATRKLQGQYLGYMHQIAKTQRAKFKKIAKTAGREGAIAAMKKALGK